MKNVVYVGYSLTDESRKLIKRKFDTAGYKTFYADHQTIIYYGKNLGEYEEAKEGKAHKIQAIGVLKTPKLICLVVGNNGEHITVATAVGVPPVASNTELKEHKDKIEYFEKPLELESKYHHYTFGDPGRKDSI